MLQQTILQSTPEIVLQRLDAIVVELQLLRQTVVALQMQQQEIPQENIVMQLYGALGQGIKDEYDPMLEWERFASE